LNLLDSGVRRNDEFLGFLTFYEYIKLDDIVKSPVPVIASSPANGGATWQSRYFKNLQKLDRRASLAMTPFSDFLRVHQA
jgi:hypothetical protein